MKTEVIQIHPDHPDEGKIAYASRIIRNGGLVIFPTETVYGIAANFSNDRTLQRLKEIKKRSEDKPFSLLIHQKDLICHYTNLNDPFVYKLIDTYWPGPLTIVVPMKGADKTIGIRMPDHPVALSLVEEAGCPVVAPSANLEGHKAPRSCQEALAQLDGLVDLAVDSGAARIGISSSVVDLSLDEPKVLREGIISQEEVNELKKKKIILFVCTGNSCRSVMAEYLLKAKIKDRQDIEVLSAGTAVFFRTPASNETIAVLKEEGMDARLHYSRLVDSILLRKSDLILVMTELHRQQVLERVREVEKRVYLLKEFANIQTSLVNSSLSLDIPDPIGKSHEDYKECLRVIQQAVNRVAGLI